jgi:ElaB/YqjD/DUF883 family membrane-anchored ribosome-binding protein
LEERRYIKQTNMMKTPDIQTQAADIGTQAKHLGDRALERIREGAGAADRMMHQNTYNVLAAGTLFGFLVGFLVSRGGRCCAN